MGGSLLHFFLWRIYRACVVHCLETQYGLTVPFIFVSEYASLPILGILQLLPEGYSLMQTLDSEVKPIGAAPCAPPSSFTSCNDTIHAFQIGSCP